MVKKMLASLIPPVFLKLGKLFQPAGPEVEFIGNYATWKEALSDSTGYAYPPILEKVKASLLKVKSGEAAYERDSVLFDAVQHSWGVVAALLKVAAENNNQLNIVDFGGSLGSHYFQNRGFLSHLSSLQWNVVEQEHFVRAGLEFFKNEELNFYFSLQEAKGKTKAPVLLASGVLQYLESPYEVIQEILSLDFEYILLDRAAFIQDGKERIAKEIVPPSVYAASYPVWFFEEKKFLHAFQNKYELAGHFLSQADPPVILQDGKRAYWKGFFLKKRK